jgi:hypothetical protein
MNGFAVTLRERDQAATPGPWAEDANGHGDGYILGRGEARFQYALEREQPFVAPTEMDAVADAALLVLLRNHARLIAAVLEAAAEVDAAMAAVRDHPDGIGLPALHAALLALDNASISRDSPQQPH